MLPHVDTSMPNCYWDSPSPPSSPSSPEPIFPSSPSHVPSQTWAQQIERISSRHLSNTWTGSEEGQIDLAYLCEACDVMQDEANIAERRYRQQILMTRAFELRYLKAQARLQRALNHRNRVVHSARMRPLLQVRASTYLILLICKTYPVSRSVC